MKKNYQLILVFVLLLLFTQACSQASNGSDAAIGSISGRVYFDENINEECEECECGLEDVKVRLYIGKCEGTFSQTAITDDDGYFTFNDLEPDTYCVYSDLDITCDGLTPTTTLSHTVELEAGEAVELEWFGYGLYSEVPPEE
jgi:hypothetical protein